MWWAGMAAFLSTTILTGAYCWSLILSPYFCSLSPCNPLPLSPSTALSIYRSLPAMIGLLYPCIDSRLGEPHKFKREWSSVMRCVAVFVGINHASAVSSRSTCLSDTHWIDVHTIIQDVRKSLLTMGQKHPMTLPHSNKTKCIYNCNTLYNQIKEVKSNEAIKGMCKVHKTQRMCKTIRLPS